MKQKDQTAKQPEESGKGHSRFFNGLQRMSNVMTLAGSILILVSLSYDIIFQQHGYLGQAATHIQLIVCLVFMADFFIRLSAAEHKWRYVAHNWFLLLVSIPLLNLTQWFQIDLSHSWYIIFKSAPLIRGFYGMIFLFNWFTRRRAQDLLVSYLGIVVGFTYFASLIFYTFEIGVNDKLTGFGDSLWWAWMNLSTVGAEIFAVTTVGKILSVVLPMLGMLLFPVFTVYVTDRFKESRSASAKADQTTGSE